MKIKVKKDGKIKRVKIGKNATVSELAKDLGITFQNYIVRINDKIVPDDEKLKEKDEVEFFRVISGG